MDIQHIPIPGRIYKHESGFVCKVICIASLTSTDQNLVVYICMDDGRFLADLWSVWTNGQFTAI